MTDIKVFIDAVKHTTLSRGSSVSEQKPYDLLIDEMASVFLQVRNADSCAYFIGNGGSAAVSIHMTVDFLKNGRMRTHSMHDPAVLTCLANDFGYEHVFGKQLEMVGRADDLLIAISSSGESPNIINGVRVARERGMKIITLSGFKKGNSLSRSGDLNVYVPSMNYGTVESIHNMILQDIVDDIKNMSK